MALLRGRVADAVHNRKISADASVPPEVEAESPIQRCRSTAIASCRHWLDFLVETFIPRAFCLHEFVKHVQ